MDPRNFNRAANSLCGGYVSNLINRGFQLQLPSSEHLRRTPRWPGSAHYARSVGRVHTSIRRTILLSYAPSLSIQVVLAQATSSVSPVSPHPENRLSVSPPHPGITVRSDSASARHYVSADAS